MKSVLDRTAAAAAVRVHKFAIFALEMSSHTRCVILIEAICEEEFKKCLFTREREKTTLRVYVAIILLFCSLLMKISLDFPLLPPLVAAHKFTAY